MFRQAEFECINSKKKQKKKGYKNSGIVSVKMCQVGFLLTFNVPVFCSCVIKTWLRTPGGEGVHIPGLRNGGLPNQLYCKF